MITRSKYTYKLIIWSFIIAYLCFSPSDGFKNVNISIPHLDKVVHFVMFYIFGVLSEALVNKTQMRRKIFVFLGLAYALSIEIVQHYFIVSRSGDWVDFIADGVGLFAGIYTFRHYPKFAKRLL